MSISSEYGTVELLGTDVAALRMTGLVEIVNEHIAARRSLLIGVANVAKLVNARKDAELRKALDETDLVLADGAPVVWLSRMIGHPLPERVAGIDIMFELMRQANDKHYRVYFLGAKPKVVENVVEIVRRDYPGLIVAGYRDGYFDQEGQQAVAEEIKGSGADILFVGISPPKKEIFLRRWREFMAVPICHGVGGSFDVVAGVTKRAPAWAQKYGLEWLYRLVQEPGRMWRRYLVTNTIFLGLCLVEVPRARFSSLRRRFFRTSAADGDT